jgi:hypothetical protein
MTTVVYHGNQSRPTPVPDVRFISSKETWPALMVERLAEAEQLVILEPMSFPYELMTEEDRDLPIVVQLPRKPDDEVLSLVLGGPLLSQLTPFDAIVLDYPSRHDFYWKHYRIGWTQTILRSSPGLLGELISRPDLSSMASHHLRELGHDPTAWCLPSRENKAKHRVQAKLLNEILSERVNLIAPQRDVRVLLAGRVSSRVLAMLPRSLASSVSVLDLGTEAVESRAIDWPHVEAMRLGPKMRFPFPRQRFDLVVLPWLYSDLPLEQWTPVTSEVVRVSRPGGLIVVIDRFVPRNPGVPVVAFDDLRHHLTEEALISLSIRDLCSMTYKRDSGPSDAALVLARLGSLERP